MSVYGLVHLLQGGRVSLVDGTPLTDEEQARTVAILQEHLMDVGDDNAEALVKLGNASNEAGMINSQKQEIDLERGSDVVNSQSHGDVKQDS